MADRILDSIESPNMLALLTDEELAILAGEIRDEILNTTSQTGGHVASSLGAVEIILAVHSLINSPEDKFIFDVGHQSYAHMLLTGRRDEFSTLRQYKGLSGFPKPHTNLHDVHPSGHASDSLSIACGLARARDLSGEKQMVVALIGDASLAGGMAFEALNDIGQEQTPLVIILNDNEMAISRNVGAMALHLGSIRVNSNYRKSRDTIQEHLESFGTAGKALVKMGKTAKESVKNLVIPDSMLFEQLGIICTPPIDGHNIPAIKAAIKNAFAANDAGYRQSPDRSFACGSRVHTPDNAGCPHVRRADAGNRRSRWWFPPSNEDSCSLSSGRSRPKVKGHRWNRGRVCSFGQGTCVHSSKGFRHSVVDLRRR